MMEMNGLTSTALAAATAVPLVAAAANVATLPKENGHGLIHHHHTVDTNPLVVSMKLDPESVHQVHLSHQQQENGVGVVTASDMVNNLGVNTTNSVLAVNAAVAAAAVAAQQQMKPVCQMAQATTNTDGGGGIGGGGGLLGAGGMVVPATAKDTESTCTATVMNSAVTVASSTPISMAVAGVNTSSSSSGGGGSGYENKLFVGGLSWQTSSEKLREYFGKFGQVLEVQVVVDPMTQRSRGFGFITFADSETVRKIVSVPNHILDGKRIDPKHATPRNKQVPAVNSYKTKKIFVGGVSQDTTLDEIKAYFGQFGKVEDAVMLMDQQTMRHRGFGFVTFESDDVVERICEIHYHTIKDKKVECKKAKPKEAQAVVAGVTGLHHAFGHDAAIAAQAAHHLGLASASALGAQRAATPAAAAAYAAFYGGLGMTGAHGAHQTHHQAATISNHLAAAASGGLGILPTAGATMVSAAPGPIYSTIRSGALARFTPYPVRNWNGSNSGLAHAAASAAHAAAVAPPPPPPPSAATQMSQPTILTSLSATQNPAHSAASGVGVPFGAAAAYHAAAAHHASLSAPSAANQSVANTTLDFSGIPGISAAAPTFDWGGVYHV